MLAELKCRYLKAHTLFRVEGFPGGDTSTCYETIERHFTFKEILFTTLRIVVQEVQSFCF